MGKLKELENSLKVLRNGEFQDVNPSGVDHDTELGKVVIQLLNLKNVNGKISTHWGMKSVKGLGATIRQLVQENS